MSRVLTDKDLAYNQISSTWRSFIANYDTDRRIEVLVNEFIDASQISEKSLFEGGCGLGYFSEILSRLNPKRMVSIDIAPDLVADLAKRLPTVECKVADLMDLSPSLGSEQYDIVFSSEVIEHTPDPKVAVGQLCSRVKPGGILILSCPNRRWIWLLHLAQKIGVRSKYLGYENWPYPKDLIRWIEGAGLAIEKREGIHTVPWQFLPKPMLRLLDLILRQYNFAFALNLAVKATRPLV